MTSSSGMSLPRCPIEFVADEQPFVLYEDNHCLALWKPPRMPVVADRSGDPSLLDRAKEYVKKKYGKPGGVYLGVVHRLDRPVSGVVLFARTSKAARRLTEQFRERAVRKVYWAVVEGKPRHREGELTHWLVKDRRRNIVKAYPEARAGARLAHLRYRVLASAEGLALLEIEPETGRPHQIRVQLAEAGHPIVGDVKYGARRRFGNAVALHARELTFRHPTSGHEVAIIAPLPRSWQQFGRLLRAIGARAQP